MLLQPPRPPPLNLATSGRHSSYVGTGEHTAWYLENEQSPSGFAAEAFLSYFILVSNLIPISLYVTMEVCGGWCSWLWVVVLQLVVGSGEGG